ncbi:hypothetical protein A7P54_14855 [Acinetobacter sp. Ac_3412]|uniref:hypothetical protein n=1 Tax=Acinetobacter sp. Ac_3412 TaxID=1848935 RepID=UPI0014902719|nr:hypothetical protein [Acinetobacter sp. Ac_3412]NNP77690.1 hypothetical protein [Acinetobacter sp. Ac_3412]
MGMGYIIGWNKSQPEDKQWTELDFNSYENSLISWLITNALEKNYPELYFNITKKESIHLIEFYELSQNDFMTAVTAIRNLIKNGDKSIAENAELWNLDIEPLVIIDERYDPNFEL